MMSLNGRCTPFIVAMVLAACGGDNSGSSESNIPRGVAVAAYEVKPQNLTREVTRTGTVEPLRVIRVAPQMSGTLLEVMVQEGDEVGPGDLLARLDIREHRAQLQRAEALLSQAEMTYERTSDLFRRGATSRAEYDQALADREVARSEVELWTTRVDFGEIRSDSNAVITQRMVESGDAVSANEAIFELSDMSTLVVRVGVSDRDVSGIVTGALVPLRMDSLQQDLIVSTVRRVFPAADPSSRLVPVELEIIGVPDGVTVRPGYLARATLNIDSRNDVLAIPGESLLASEGDEQWVYMIINNRLQRQDVETGVARRNWTEILGGLERGDIIVGTNPTNFREDMQVRITQWIDGEPAEIVEERISRAD